MKTLYHLYNSEFIIKNAEYFNLGQQPKNAVYVENMSFIKPMFNADTLQVYEGAIQEDFLVLKNAEIEVLRLKTETEIDAFISPYVQKLILRQVEIPVEIMQEYNAMRAAYGIEKQIILDK
jgi:hypothetical protein